MISPTASRCHELTVKSVSSTICDQTNISFTEEYVLDDIAKEAELHLFCQHEQTREGRRPRHQELEKDAKENDNWDLAAMSNSSSTSTNSRKCNIDNVNDGTETISNSSLFQKFFNGDIDLRSIERKELRHLLSDLETKYKSLMRTNSSLFNEKEALRYQIDMYKDILDEHYENFNQTNRQLRESRKELDTQKQTLVKLQQNHSHLRQILTDCVKLIRAAEPDTYDNARRECTFTLRDHLSLQENHGTTGSHVEIHLNDLLKRILNQKQEQYEEILHLKSELNEAKCQLGELKEQTSNLIDSHHHKAHCTCDFRERNQWIKQMCLLTNRLEQLSVDHGSLQQENLRYEGQLTRFKQQLDESERTEDELKHERRQLQRELRIVADKLADEHIRNDILQREIERLRTLRKQDLLSSSDDKLSSSRSHSPLLSNRSNEFQSTYRTEDFA